MSTQDGARSGAGRGTAAPPPTPGAASETRELGVYLDEGVIGTGGMSSIHRVFDRVIGRRVAMKFLSPAFAAKPAEVERFFDEARVTGRLDHPNIPPVHAFGLEQGRPYFTMKLVDGRTLHDLLQAPTYSPSDSRELFATLVESA